MSKEKQFQAQLPYDCSRIRLFILLAQEIYDIFDCDNDIHIEHGDDKINLKKLKLLCKNMNDIKSDNRFSTPLIKIKFINKTKPTIILENLLSYIMSIDAKEIATLEAKTTKKR